MPRSFLVSRPAGDRYLQRLGVRVDTAVLSSSSAKRSKKKRSQAGGWYGCQLRAYNECFLREEIRA